MGTVIDTDSPGTPIHEYFYQGRNKSRPALCYTYRSCIVRIKRLVRFGEIYAYFNVVYNERIYV